MTKRCIPIIAQLCIVHMQLHAEPAGIPAAPAPDSAPAKETIELRSAELPGAFRQGVNVRNLGPVTAGELHAVREHAQQRFGTRLGAPRRVGLVRTLGENVVDLQYALKQAGGGGNTVWTAAVHSPGAHALRLHFDDVDLKSGRLAVFARGGNGTVTRGPFSRRGPAGTGSFWTASLPGDTAYIEFLGAPSASYKLVEIVHFDRNPAALGAQGGLFNCHQDANCYASDTLGRAATGQMNFMDGQGSFVCTGTLLNDADADTTVPYFLTAFHCVSTQEHIDTLEVVWDWQSDECDGELPDYFALDRNTGGTLLATNPTNGGTDMSFIRLDGPVYTARAGITSAPLPESIIGYHHPGGSWKRAVVGHQNTVTGCDGLPTSDYHYLIQDEGVIEGGSSGSAIFDGESRVLGQLFGVCCPSSHSVGCGGSSCCLSDCSNRDEYNTVYGRMDVSWPLIQPWLFIGGTIHVDGDHSGEELGTPKQPFSTVGDANAIAWDGARISIQAGNYNETITFTHELEIVTVGGAVSIGQ